MGSLWETKMRDNKKCCQLAFVLHHHADLEGNGTLRTQRVSVDMLLHIHDLFFLLLLRAHSHGRFLIAAVQNENRTGGNISHVRDVEVDLQTHNRNEQFTLIITDYHPINLH